MPPDALDHDDPIYLYLIADDPLARAGLAMWLENQPAYVLLEQGHSQAEWLLTLAEAGDGDVLLWDLGWNPAEPLPDMRELAMPVVALMPDAATAAAAWDAGATVLLLRGNDLATLTLGLAAAANNLILIDPALAAPILPSPNPDAPILSENLTSREQDVLQLLAEGLANKNIARQLNISEHTVKFHVNAIMNKLGAQSRTEAVVRATRAGLILLQRSS